MATSDLTMPVLDKKGAEEFLRTATLGKNLTEVKRLRCLLAKLQAVQSHMSLLSNFDMINELLQIAQAAHVRLHVFLCGLNR